MTNPFHFKRFTIVQERSAMKVGIDGVLLGAWACVDEADRILDIGTGTGLIALMLAQRTENHRPPCRIDAIEIDSGAADEARLNFSNSPWSERLILRTGDVRNVAAVDQRYDLIACNPPFFSEGTVSPNERRRAARHSSQLSREDLFRFASQVLNDAGRLAMITLHDNEKKEEATASHSGLFVNRRLRVRPKPGRDFKRQLTEYSRIKREFVNEEITLEDPPLDDGQRLFTSDFKSLTEEFYLDSN